MVDIAGSPGSCLPGEGVAGVVTAVVLHSGSRAGSALSVGELLHPGGSVPQPGPTDGVTHPPPRPGGQPAVRGTLQAAGFTEVGGASTQGSVHYVALETRRLHTVDGVYSTARLENRGIVTGKLRKILFVIKPKLAELL